MIAPELERYFQVRLEWKLEIEPEVKVRLRREPNAAAESILSRTSFAVQCIGILRAHAARISPVGKTEPLTAAKAERPTKEAQSLERGIPPIFPLAQPPHTRYFPTRAAWSM